jgi:hypothetical protein
VGDGAAEHLEGRGNECVDVWMWMREKERERERERLLDGRRGAFLCGGLW